MKMVTEEGCVRQGIIDAEGGVDGEALFQLLLDGRQSLDDLCYGLGLELAGLLMRIEQRRVVGEFYVRGSRYERAGSDPGSVVLGGARRRVRRLRVKEKGKGKSVPLRSYVSPEKVGFF